NQEAAKFIYRYLQPRARIRELLSREYPDSAALKRLSDEMAAEQDKLNMIDDIVAMTQARAAFAELIKQVNEVLQFIVTGQVEGESECTGSCSPCGGPSGVQN